LLTYYGIKNKYFTNLIYFEFCNFLYFYEIIINPQKNKSYCLIINTLDPIEKIKAIKMLGQEKIKQSIDFLIDYFQQTSSSYIKAEIIKTFQKFEDSKVNELLIEQLQSGFSEIRQAAIEALATCGKKSAVASLHKMTQDPIIPDYIKNKAKYAIAQIQSRIGYTGEGCLSVATPSPAEGALSLKEDTAEAGLSITDAETPRDELDNE